MSIQAVIDMGVTVNDDDEVVMTIHGKNEIIFYNDAHIDCPEDLIWERDISEVFKAGIKYGLAIAKQEEG